MVAVFNGVPLSCICDAILAQFWKYGNKRGREMLHRNGGACALLVRISCPVLSISTINQWLIALARRLLSKIITAIFRQRGWADGDDAMR
jgi:hypothetical protein